MQNYNICFSLDSKYVEQFAVSAVSILKNADVNDNITFYILDGGLTEKDKNDIEILKNIKYFNIEYLEVNEKDFKDCPMLKEKSDEHKDYHVTIPTYFRFKLPELLPQLDKVLYLDCDVIVRSSLGELYSTSLKDKAVAMVEDVESKKESKRLDLKYYYNAGVMLINLDYWRKNDVTASLFAYAKEYNNKILWQDQDVINVVLEGKIKPLKLKWNYQYFLYDKIKENDLTDCLILHLAGRFKPWLIPFEHFIYDYYYSYLYLTPFAKKIVEYKQKSSGKHLKNNVGGSVTNVVDNVSVDDIQKIYQEIAKNYDFTNSLPVKFDEKLSKIYAEITKNYDYTNELREISKQEIVNSKEEVIQQVNASADAITVQTDEKISGVYAEITKNYDYTNELRDASKFELSEVRKEVFQEINAKDSLLNEKMVIVERNIIDDIDNTKNSLISRIEEVNNSSVLGLKDLKTILDLNIDFTKKELTTLYEKVVFNDEVFRKDLNELRNDFVNLLNDKIQFLISQTDEKIGKVYEEITKNYNYTNELREASKYEITEVKKDLLLKVDESKNEVLQQLNTNTEVITSQTDEKISRVYDEISKNYDYTNRLSQENKDLAYSLKNEVEGQLKTAQDNIYSYIDHSNEVVASNADEKLNTVKAEVNDKITKLEEAQERKNNLKISEVYAYTNSELTKVFTQLNENNSNYEYKLEYSLKNSEHMLEENKSEVSNLKLKIEEQNILKEELSKKLQVLDVEHKKQIENLTATFEEKIDSQRVKYENKFKIMEKQINELELKYIESKKGFFTKIVEKCKKR